MAIKSTGSDFLEFLAARHVRTFCEDANCWCKNPDSYDYEY